MEIESRCGRDTDGAIFVKDENGDVVYKGSRPMSIKELGEQLAEEFPSLAKATGTPGGKDATPGQKVNGRLNRLPESWAELQAMPNGQDVLARMKKENPEQVRKILSGMKF
jgi:hypothetical protein